MDHMASSCIVFIVDTILISGDTTI
jgi:hypothetical protein